MKKFIIFAVLVVLSMPVFAQNKLSYAKRDSLTATGVTTAAKNTRGYDTYLTFTDQLPIGYTQRMFAVQFTKVTDSVKFQGGSIDYGTLPKTLPWGSAGAGKVDTSWTDLQVNPGYKIAGTYIAGLFVPQRDTAVTWISPVTTDRMKFNVDMTGGKYAFDCYRIVSAVNDSGKTYIQLKMGGGW